MSSASPGSATRFRMKLLSRACSRSTASEIRSSCLAIIHCLLRASTIYTCRRLSATKYCRKTASIVDAGPDNSREHHEDRRLEGRRIRVWLSSKAPVIPLKAESELIHLNAPVQESVSAPASSAIHQR